jgi:hypothetical protein
MEDRKLLGSQRWKQRLLTLQCDDCQGERIRIHPEQIKNELRHLQRKPIRQSVLFAGKCVSC